MLAYAGTYHIADIIAALQNADEYRNMAGDTGKLHHLDTLIDAERAFDLAGFTEHQEKIVTLRWKVGLTQQETSTYIGSSQQSVWEAEKAAKKKVQAVLRDWGNQPC